MAKEKSSYNKDYYEANKEQFREANNKWKKANRNNYLKSQKRYNDKRRRGVNE